MRKRIKQRKFGRTSDQRRALLKSLASNLILRERIETSLAKAKEVRPLNERERAMITGTPQRYLGYAQSWLPPEIPDFANCR